MRRLPAEWEPQSAVMLCFPHDQSDWKEHQIEVEECFIRIIQVISSYQLVILLCHHIDYVSSLLKKYLCKNYLLIEVESNDCWVRDYGPITVLEQGKPILLDFIFNGWGLKFAADKDNLINKHLKEQAIFGNVRLQTLPFVLEGGSIESDGQGTIMTTENCLLSANRNDGIEKESIEQILQAELGAQRILWLRSGQLIGDDTDGHIDTLARFVSADTIMYVQCRDKKDDHYTSLLQMEEELRAFRKADGSPYNLIPLPMAEALYNKGKRLPASYANFLIINGAVLVPTYGTPDTDDCALNVIAQFFSDRKVIGIDCSALVMQNGALHCVTMQFPSAIRFTSNPKYNE